MPDPIGAPPKRPLFPAASSWWALHLWQIQPIRDVLVVAAVVGLIYLGYRLSLVTVPILLAMLLAYLFEPLVRRMAVTPMFSRQGAAVAIIVAALLLAVVPLSLGVGFAVVQGADLVVRVGANASKLNDALRDETRKDALPAPWRKLYDKIVELEQKSSSDERGDIQRTAQLVLSYLEDNAATIGAAVGKEALGTGATAAAIVLRTLRSLVKMTFTLFLTAFFFYFFSTGYGRVLAFWESLIPERRKGRVIELLQKMDRVIAGFVRGRLTICAILMVYYSLAYWLIGVPVPLLLGPVVGAFALVPFLTTVAIPVAMLLMAIEPSPVLWQQNWWWIVGAPFLVYFVERILDDYILTPAIQGKHTEMAIPAILFASLAGGILGGVYGLLIAIPVAACLRIVLREVVWPRIQAWAHGEERDILPISRD
jgi:predicted PurR-regulated permease PerM